MLDSPWVPRGQATAANHFPTHMRALPGSPSFLHFSSCVQHDKLEQGVTDVGEASANKTPSFQQHEIKSANALLLCVSFSFFFKV